MLNFREIYDESEELTSRNRVIACSSLLGLRDTKRRKTQPSIFSNNFIHDNLTGNKNDTSSSLRSSLPNFRRSSKKISHTYKHSLNDIINNSDGPLPSKRSNRHLSSTVKESKFKTSSRMQSVLVSLENKDKEKETQEVIVANEVKKSDKESLNTSELAKEPYQESDCIVVIENNDEEYLPEKKSSSQSIKAKPCKYTSNDQVLLKKYNDKVIKELCQNSIHDNQSNIDSQWSNSPSKFHHKRSHSTLSPIDLSLDPKRLSSLSLLMLKKANKILNNMLLINADNMAGQLNDDLKFLQLYRTPGTNQGNKKSAILDNCFNNNQEDYVYDKTRIKKTYSEYLHIKYEKVKNNLNNQLDLYGKIAVEKMKNTIDINEITSGNCYKPYDLPQLKSKPFNNVKSKHLKGYEDAYVPELIWKGHRYSKELDYILSFKTIEKQCEIKAELKRRKSSAANLMSQSFLDISKIPNGIEEISKENSQISSEYTKESKVPSNNLCKVMEVEEMMRKKTIQIEVPNLSKVNKATGNNLGFNSLRKFSKFTESWKS